MDYCRLCYLEINAELCENIFNEKFHPPLWKIINELTQLIVMKNDPYTKVVCLQCCLLLKKFDAFRSTALKTDWKIRQNANLPQLLRDDDFNDPFGFCPPIQVDNDEYFLVEEVKKDDNSGFEKRNNCGSLDCNTLKNEHNSIGNSKVFGGDGNNNKTGGRIGTNTNKESKFSSISNNIADNGTDLIKDNDAPGKASGRHFIDAEIKVESIDDGQPPIEYVNIDYKDSDGYLCDGFVVKEEKIEFEDHPLIIDDESDIVQIPPVTETGTKQRQFKCDKCNRTFLKKNYLTLHLKVHSNKYRRDINHTNNLNNNKQKINKNRRYVNVPKKKKLQYRCEACKKAFPRRVNLIFHMKKHRKEEMIKNEINIRENDNKSNIIDTKTIKNESPKSGEKVKFQCDHCDKSFPRRINLDFHLKKHRKEAQDEADLLSKLNNNQTGNGNVTIVKNELYTIEIINKPDLSDNDEKQDQENSTKQQFQCEECNKTFPRKVNLDFHKKKHVKEAQYYEQFKQELEKQLTGNTELQIDDNREVEKLVNFDSNKSQCRYIFCQKHDLKSNNIEKLCNNRESLETPKDMTIVQNDKISEKPAKTKYRCDKCKKTFQQRNHLNFHLRKHAKDDEYSCSFCHKKFPLKYTLENHLKSNNIEKQCKICDRAFTAKCCYDRHVKKHLNANKGKRLKPQLIEFYYCDCCDKKFREKSQLSDHLRSEHYTNKSYKCKICERIFLKRGEFLQHLQSHTNYQMCDICDRMFLNECSLRDHFRIHTGTRLIKCNICDKQFLHRSHLSVHLLIHTNERSYSCQMCDKRFLTQMNLARHLNVHIKDLKLYICNVCGKQYKANTTLKNHQKIHTGERPYSCNMCDQRFRVASILEQHQRTHTGEKPYVCGTCGRKFTQHTNLRRHLLLHTTGGIEKNHVCNVCEKRFCSQQSLRIHLRSHTGEKPYDCGICDRRFSAKTTLQQHQYTHTGERPYCCEICGRKFSIKSNLRRHLLLHNGKS